MRSSQADLIALTELHGTMGPCVVHIEDYVLVVNDRAGWLMSLEFYVLWSQSGKRRWDRGDNLCALSFNFCNKTDVFVAVYLLPFVRVADRRQSLAELDCYGRLFRLTVTRFWLATGMPMLVWITLATTFIRVSFL